MFDNLQNIDLFPATVSEIILNILVALICGLFLGRLYKNINRGRGYSIGFVHAIVLLGMITSVVIMVVGNNLARAFGLVGTLSIIRFRTAIKDTQDLVFIFFALSMGLAAGAGFYKIAFIGTLFISLIIYTLSKTSILTPKQRDYLLQFFCANNGDQSPEYLRVFDEYCRNHKVINIKSVDSRDMLEVSYYIRFKDNQKSSQFMQALQKVRGIEDINLYFDEEEV
ncbi:MAG TPA: hypothetical protein DEO84_02925 [candidate division Zixibacteria bacterium]|jgi:uncharacterized membrane protein YhiD involved in acid resistance|nr:hypothetical protein [candidate division Zixibacteria bacterium]HBZ00253.1 hypothetical protein [candidate division Zixibacteria bacterium]